MLNDHIPALLDELVVALQSDFSQTIPEALLESSPAVHGLQRLQEAFDIQEVVAPGPIFCAAAFTILPKTTA